jgi:hypothetical protein
LRTGSNEAPLPSINADRNEVNEQDRLESPAKMALIRKTGDGEQYRLKELAFVDWFNEANEKTGSSRLPWPLSVRDHSPFRRWKRPHRACHRRYESCSVRKEFAAFLQQIGARPAGARHLLRSS